MIPLKINGKHLCEIFTPGTSVQGWSDRQIHEYSTQECMYPREVHVTSETYSRNAERTADYELEELTIVNRKSKLEVTWGLIKAEYVERLLGFLNYIYDFKDTHGDIVPVEAATYQVQYQDFVGTRVIDAYLGQTLDGTLVVYNEELYWENFRLAFPER